MVFSFYRKLQILFYGIHDYIIQSSICIDSYHFEFFVYLRGDDNSDSFDDAELPWKQLQYHITLCNEVRKSRLLPIYSTAFHFYVKAGFCKCDYISMVVTKPIALQRVSGNDYASCCFSLIYSFFITQSLYLSIYLILKGQGKMVVQCSQCSHSQPAE